MKNTLGSIFLLFLLFSFCISCSRSMIESTSSAKPVEEEKLICPSYNRPHVKPEEIHYFYGRHPIHEAVERNDLHMVGIILDYEFYIEEENEEGLTPLELAVKLDRIEIMKLLICRGAEIHDWNGTTILPLHNAAKFGHLDIVKWFTKNNLNIENKTYTSENTPLYIAACHGNFDVVEYLLTKGAKINLKKSSGITDSPVDCAANNRQLKMANFLLKQGATLALEKYPPGYSPMFLPAEKGYLDVVKFWVSKKVDIDRKDIINETALFKAIRKGHLEVVKYLVNQGARTDIRSKFGSTPFMLAKKLQKKKIAEYLKTIR